jgi:hypothetical protein
VWSAPNYCHRYENLASILELDEQLNEYFNIFEEAPENTRDKKVEKQRDIHSAASNASASTRSSMGSNQGQGRNQRGREDYFY